MKFKNVPEEENTILCGLLSIMDDISHSMPEVILKKYYDKDKYVYSLYLDFYFSIAAICYTISNAFMAQSAVILRMAIEQCVTLVVLEKYPELKEAYSEHKRFGFEVYNNKKSNCIRSFIWSCKKN